MHKEKKKISGLATEICIWKEPCECGDCKLNERIFCHPKMKYILYFATPLFIGIIPAVLGVFLSTSIDILWKLIFFAGWIGYSFFFFNIWESWMVCNHCPYYANDEQRSLHCAIDKGKLKTGKYNPGPASTSEKIQFAIGASLFMIYPIPFLFLFNLLIPMIIYIAGVISWLVVVQLKVCSDCINFACVMNRVPKEVKNEFMKRNPMIWKAWEEKGYTLD